MTHKISVVFFALAISCAFAFEAVKPKPARTPHLTFVTEYVRELAAVEKIREDGEQELKASKETGNDARDVFSISIHTSTLMQLELGSQIRSLKAMHLEPPFDETVRIISGFYAHKIDLYQRMIEISSAFIGGPKPGADYDSLAAEMPKMRAKLEFIDKAIFDATPLICASLIDRKPDSKGHASHLIITKVEREALVRDITNRFGSKLDQNDQSYMVAAASVLKAYLLKDFKCADDPWE